MTSSSHAERYQGRNLLWLILAICGPAALLFLRIVLTFAWAQTRTVWLGWAGTVMLVLFFIAQAAGAWHMRTMLPARPQAWANALQLVGVFLMGLFFSITGAILLEAFGYSLFIHLRRA